MAGGATGVRRRRRPQRRSGGNWPAEGENNDLALRSRQAASEGVGQPNEAALTWTDEFGHVTASPRYEAP